MNTFFVLLALALLPQEADILLADFDGADYGDWKAEGEAFGSGPARGTLEKQQEVSGFLGKGLVNTYFKGDGSQGKLTSPEFTVSRRRINFLIGGGWHDGATAINLLVDGKIVRSATGPNAEFLRWNSWDVAEFAGKKARIEIVDRHTGGWGHINIDHIVLSDAEAKTVDDRDGAIARAAASVKASAERASKDPSRPIYHFLPPGNWMNDPNGPIQYKGEYHMFYQQNPYGDAWNHMHWGHAVSKDLVRWEHKPIALWPSKVRNEDHCFSGCAAVDAQGRLMLLYTSIGGRAPEQWGAVAEDDAATKFKKLDVPLLTIAHHGDVKIDDWRDPFVFKEEGRWYMALGGHRAGGKGCVLLYDSEDLVKWKFLGIPFEGSEGNWECPNLFKLDGKWVLIYSPHGIVKYYTGALDLKAVKFTPERHGTLDGGADYYAPNGLEDDQGRRIVWGWVKGFKGGQGWNGCLTLPRVLNVLPDGSLRQRPAIELEKLRGDERRAAGLDLSGPVVSADVRGDTLEILAEFEPGDAKSVGLKVRRSADGARGVHVLWTGEHLELAGSKAPFKLAPGEKTLRLHVFIDRSVAEVYANGRACVTKVIYAPAEDLGVELFARGGKARLVSLSAWPLKSIW